MSSSRNWRLSVINKYFETNDLIKSCLGDDVILRMKEFAEKIESEENSDTEHNENKQNEHITKNGKSKIILKSMNSYMQQIDNSKVPYHFQVVIPEAYGTVELTSSQQYEVSMFIRCLTIIALQNDVGTVFLEFCTGAPPLIIDVFISPPSIKNYDLYWTQALEDDETKLIRLKSKIMKTTFPPHSQYISLNFEEGDGFGRQYFGGYNPVITAADVVASLWRDYKEEPPNDYVKTIKEYNGWPQ